MVRGLSPRDAILVLLGAACMHIASTIFAPFSEPSSIVVNTHVTSHTGNSDDFQNGIYEVVHPAPLEHPDVNAAAEYPPPGFPLDSNPSDSLRTPTQLELHVDIEAEIPETTLVSHAPGWTIFRNLYMADGTLFIVTSQPELFPAISLMTSTGLPAENTPESIEARMPTDRDMTVITPAEARARWGADKSVVGERNRLFPVSGSTVRIIFVERTISVS